MKDNFSCDPRAPLLSLTDGAVLTGPLTFTPPADGSQNGLVYTPPAGAPQSFARATEVTPSLTFCVGGNKPVMTFHPDGRVTADPDMDADEAARKIIDIIIQCWPAMLARPV